MIKKFALTIAMGMFAAIASNAQAGLLETIAPFDGAADTLKDNSFAQVYRKTGLLADPTSYTRVSTGPLAIGDIIVGLIRIDARTSPTGYTVPDTDQLFGLYSVQIAAPTASALLTFNNVGTDPLLNSGLSLEELISPTHYAGLALTGTSTAVVGGESFWSTAAIAVLEKSGTANPLEDTVTDGLSIISSITAAGSGWKLDAIANINAANGDYFLTRPALDDFLVPVLDPDATDFSIAERAGLTIAANSLGSGTQFIPVAGQKFGVAPAAQTKHDLVIVDVTQVTGADPIENPNWDLEDSATISVNIVPEPGSMTLLGLGLLGLAGAGYRRRKAEKIEA